VSWQRYVVRHLTDAGPTRLAGRERGWAPPRGEEHQSWMWSCHAPVGAAARVSSWVGPRQEPGRLYKSWSQPDPG